MIRRTLTAAAFAAMALPAAANPVSPACAFLTPEVQAAWGKTGSLTDGGAPQYGMSNCTWRAEDMSMLIVTLMEGETISGMGGAEKAFDGYARSFQAGMKSSPEAIDGLGDQSLLLLDGEGAYQSAVVMILKGERIVSLSLAQTDRDTAIAVGKAVGGAM